MDRHFLRQCKPFCHLFVFSMLIAAMVIVSSIALFVETNNMRHCDEWLLHFNPHQQFATLDKRNHACVKYSPSDSSNRNGDFLSGKGRLTVWIGVNLINISFLFINILDDVNELIFLFKFGCFV